MCGSCAKLHLECITKSVADIAKHSPASLKSESSSFGGLFFPCPGMNCYETLRWDRDLGRLFTVHLVHEHARGTEAGMNQNTSRHIGI